MFKKLFTIRNSNIFLGSIFTYHTYRGYKQLTNRDLMYSEKIILSVWNGIISTGLFPITLSMDIMRLESYIRGIKRCDEELFIIY
jgi:hypothetical protein